MKITVSGHIILQYRSKATNETTHSATILIEGDEEDTPQQVTAQYNKVVGGLLPKEEICQ